MCFCIRTLLFLAVKRYVLDKNLGLLVNLITRNTRKVIRFFHQNSVFTTKSALANHEDLSILRVIRVAHYQDINLKDLLASGRSRSIVLQIMKAPTLWI
jgi:hypothetical protein